jgi:hypothetical protein
LFVVYINGRECHIPPEFCYLDGVPDTIKNNAFKWKQIMDQCRKNPVEKKDCIQKFSKELFSKTSNKTWGLEIDSQPMSVEALILDPPTVILNNGKNIDGTSQNLRKLSIQFPKHLKFEKWVFAYDKRNFQNADFVFSTLKKASN